MQLTRAKVLLVTLLVSAGHVFVPSVGSVLPTVEAAAFINGSSRFQAVAPARLADTRPDEGAYGFEPLSPQVVRVQVAGRKTYRRMPPPRC